MRTSDISVLVPPKTAAPTPQRMATRGTVAIPPASITDDTVTVTLPSYSADYGWPCRWVRQGNTLPAIGAECLVLWDETGAGTVVQWAGAGVALPTVADVIPEALRLVGAVGQPAFQNSWANFDAVRPLTFYRHQGRTHIQGIVQSGIVGAAIFALPAGYMPVNADASNPLTFPVDSNAAYGRLFVYGVTGAVVLGAGSNIYANVNGISFRHA